MKRTIPLLAFFAVGLAALLAGVAVPQEPVGPPNVSAQPPDQAPPDDGTEPQTRGPLHEAFAEPAVANPQPGPIIPKKPPDPIEEMPPDQKPEGNNVQWIPGYWEYDDESADFLWVSGFWRDVPPDRRWVPGYWVQYDDEGWQRVPGYWEQAQQTDVEYLLDPPHNIDAGPSTPAPSADSTYVPGCWVFSEQRYLWRPGFWMPVQPGWVYTPARYCWTPAGCIFLEGYWDYALENRGLLFCPVTINVQVWQPARVYRPHYCIATPALFTALFARPAFGHYYFGDYFAPEYHKAGFIPWPDYTVVRGAYNPLYSYYHARYDRDWVKTVKQVYVERREGILPPPPATFRQQVKVVQNLATGGPVQINQQTFKVRNAQALVQQMSVVAPLTQVAKFNTKVRLQPVPKEMLVSVQKHVAELHQVAQQRRQFDIKTAQAVVKAEKAGTLPAGPIAKFALPKVAAAPPVPEGKGKAPAPPPAPPAPKPVTVKAPAPAVAAPPKLEPKPNVIKPRPVEEKVLPKEEKSFPKDGKGFPKEEKVLPKEEKSPVKLPVVEPKKEEKVLPKEEKSPVKPPVVQPKKEEKVLPKEEKLPVKPPVTLPKEEKLPVKPPPAPPKKEEKKKEEKELKSSPAAPSPPHLAQPEPRPRATPPAPAPPASQRPPAPAPTQPPPPQHQAPPAHVSPPPQHQAPPAHTPPPEKKGRDQKDSK
jgi:hypothetical protein